MLACRWPSSPYVLTWPFINVCETGGGERLREGERERGLSDGSSYKATNPIGLGPCPHDLINLITSLFQIQPQLEVEVSTYGFWGEANI